MFLSEPFLRSDVDNSVVHTVFDVSPNVERVENESSSIVLAPYASDIILNARQQKPR